MFVFNKILIYPTLLIVYIDCISNLISSIVTCI